MKFSSKLLPIFTCALFLNCSVLAVADLPSQSAEKIESDDPEATLPKIGSLSKEQFFRISDDLCGSFGSGGFALQRHETDWMSANADFFEAREIDTSENADWKFCLAVSLGKLGSYKAAAQLFTSLDQEFLAETMEWKIRNPDPENEIVLVEKSGAPDFKNWSIGEKLEDGDIVYMSLFKGPLIRVDRNANTYVILNVPDSQYDWAFNLELDSERNTLIFSPGRDGSDSEIELSSL